MLCISTCCNDPYIYYAHTTNTKIAAPPLHTQEKFKDYPYPNRQRVDGLPINLAGAPIQHTRKRPLAAGTPLTIQDLCALLQKLEGGASVTLMVEFDGCAALAIINGIRRYLEDIPSVQCQEKSLCRVHYNFFSFV